MKKLKIQFWKAEKALAMQILEQEGLPEYKNDGFVRTEYSPTLGSTAIFLGVNGFIHNPYINLLCFKSNSERDAHLQKVVDAITDELFTDEGELKIGEMCHVSDDVDDSCWEERKLLAILPIRYKNPFITESESGEHCVSWSYARPSAKRAEPTVEECGQLITYTWEEK